jgi:hypothetical protein
MGNTLIPFYDSLRQILVILQQVLYLDFVLYSVEV